MSNYIFMPDHVTDLFFRVDQLNSQTIRSADWCGVESECSDYAKTLARSFVNRSSAARSAAEIRSLNLLQISRQPLRSMQLPLSMRQQNSMYLLGDRSPAWIR